MLFRARCNEERNLLLSTGSKHNSKPSKEGSTVPTTAHWKRVTVRERALFSLFVSIQSHNTALVLDCVRTLRDVKRARLAAASASQELRQLTNSAADGAESVAGASVDNNSNSQYGNGSQYSENIKLSNHYTRNVNAINALRVISSRRLISAFQCVGYLFNPGDSADAGLNVNSTIPDNLSRNNTSTNLLGRNASGMSNSNSNSNINSSAKFVSSNSVSSMNATSSNNMGTISGSTTATTAAAAAVDSSATTWNSSNTATEVEIIFHDFCFAMAL